MQRFIIGKAISLERKRLEGLVNRILKDDFKLHLDKLVNGKTENWYTLTWLSRESPQFQTTIIKAGNQKKSIYRTTLSNSKIAG